MMMDRRCWFEIDLNLIAENYRRAQRRVGNKVKIIAVLKADAYGMGAVKVGEKLYAEGVRSFAVATAAEAAELEAALPPDIEVLPLGYCSEAEMRDRVLRGKPITLYSIRQAHNLLQIARECGKKARVHVKIDSGLHRLGFVPETAADEISTLLESEAFELCALFTHLALHNEAMDVRAVESFLTVRRELEERGITVPFIHVLDTLGMVRHPRWYFDGVRLGAWLYGVAPAVEHEPSLMPARFMSRISQIHTLAAGEMLGYDDEFHLPRDSRIATVTAGYVDGLPRRAPNWYVAVHGKHAAVMGIACMDQLLIDVTDIPEAAEGDEVCFIGDGIHIDEYARMAGLNHNQAWACIGKRVERVYIDS